MSHEAVPATRGEGEAPELAPGLQPLADAAAHDMAAVAEIDRFSPEAILSRFGSPWREPAKGFRAIAEEIAAVAAFARAEAAADASVSPEHRPGSILDARIDARIDARECAAAADRRAGLAGKALAEFDRCERIDRERHPLPSAQQETTMDTAGRHADTHQQSSAFNPDAYGTANGAGTEAPQPQHGSDIDAINRRISDLERHAYGQAGRSFDEHAEATSRETFGDAEAAARAYDADVRQQIGSLRQVLGLQVMLLIHSVHAGAAEVAGNPSAIGAADEAFAQAQDAIGSVRAALAALAELPPLVSAPLSSEDLASRFAFQQSLCVDRIGALVWQLRSYSDLIQNRPLNVPATVSVERTLHDISADVQTLTSGFGLIREEVLRRMASEQRPSPQPAGAA